MSVLSGRILSPSPIPLDLTMATSFFSGLQHAVVRPGAYLNRGASNKFGATSFWGSPLATRSACQFVAAQDDTLGYFKARAPPKISRGVVEAAGKKPSAPKKGFAPKATGFGAKPIVKAKTGDDSVALLRRSEQRYTNLVEEHWQEGNLREFIICVRQKVPTGKEARQLADWVPVAEMALKSDLEASVAMHHALPLLCREVAECVTQGAPSLKGIPREKLEYAYESLDSFEKHVRSNSTEVVTKEGQSCPYETLGLPPAAPPAQVRTAYRAMAALYHPDRNIDGDKGEVEEKFKQIREAYDKIQSASLEEAEYFGSNYAALGGNGREGLSSALQVTACKAGTPLPQGMEAAVRMLDPDIVRRFLLMSRPKVGKQQASKATAGATA